MQLIFIIIHIALILNFQDQLDMVFGSLRFRKIFSRKCDNGFKSFDKSFYLIILIHDRINTIRIINSAVGAILDSNHKDYKEQHSIPYSSQTLTYD